MTIVENVLDSVEPHTMCAFILPDKKLEKANKTQVKRILKHHRLRKVVKLPEDLFFNVGVTTSIFIFESGIGQAGKEFFACYMESDGLATVKNKGCHDVYGRWSDIEARWVDIVLKQSGDDTCQWIDPEEHLSYQAQQKLFEISEEDFKKTAMDYLMFQRGIDAKQFTDSLLNIVLYSSQVLIADETISVTMKRGDKADLSCATHDIRNNLAPFEQENNVRSVETAYWGEFIVGDLFEKFVKPPVLHTRQIVETEDGIPYVVRTKFDNGVKCRVKPVMGVEPSPAGVISWGAENATFFYQEEPFLSGRDIYYIDTTDLKPMTCRFLTACLQKIASKYPYNYGLFPDLLKDERIKLPVTQEGRPDWDYMEKYMTQVTVDAESNLNAFEQLIC